MRAHIKVVGFEATPFEALKCLTSIVEALTSFGETDATNAGGASDTRLAGRLSGFVFDIHYAWRGHAFILAWISWIVSKAREIGQSQWVDAIPAQDLLICV